MDHHNVLIVGLGAAGLAIVRQLPAGCIATVVEPKDFIEFTPGCLRAFCDIDHWKTLVVSVQDALDSASPSSVQASWLQGRVEVMRERVALVDKGEQRAQIAQRSSNTPCWSFVKTSPPARKDFVEISFDYAIVVTGSTNGLWKPAARMSCNRTFREVQIKKEHDRLAQAEQAALAGDDNDGFPRVVVHGAGIVGVELVAEIVEYFPGLGSHVMLLSRSEQILPAHPVSVADYATRWCERHGVQIKCGDECREFQAWLNAEEEKAEVRTISYLCVGGTPSLPQFDPPVARVSEGYALINSKMQILRSEDEKDVWADGRVFAFGDCAEVYGLEGKFPKTIYPAEGNSSVVAQNLRDCLECGDCDKQASPMLSPTIISLGAHDSVIDVSGHHVASGFLASCLKCMVEKSKMNEANGGIWGSLLWKMVPHI